MPLFQIKSINPHTRLGIWHIQESTDELLAQLPPYVSLAEIERVHPKRKREWLASRVLVYTLLTQFTQTPAVLKKDENGKPYFEHQALHISITHSPDFAAVIISNKYEVGIDIELISQKALRVAHKFLSNSEKEFTAENEIQTCLYWSAKETLYKLYSRKQLVFKDNLMVRPGSSKNELAGRVRIDNFDKLYVLQHETFCNHILTYCISDHQQT